MVAGDRAPASGCARCGRRGARVELELLRARLWERRATWEDVLRDHGEVVARTCCEWCDLHGIDIR
jgi:hypothetical protein